MSALPVAFESCDRAVVQLARLGRRRDVRAQFGLCLCGTPIAWHFDGDNRKLDCFDPAVVRARLRTALQHAAHRTAAAAPASTSDRGEEIRNLRRSAC